MTTADIFNEEVADRLEAVYRTPEMVAQRRATIDALAPTSGERIVDVGCGPGLLVCDLAPAVAPDGHITGIDISDDMLTVARRHQAESPHRDSITITCNDAIKLPFPDSSLDALVSAQVYEYVPDIERALAEAHRVLRPGGRILILDTDWDSLVWHTDNRDLMRAVIAAWTERFADPHLPPTLRRRLTHAGFAVEPPKVFAVLNPRLDPDSYSAHHIAIITAFVQDHGVTASDAQAWASDLQRLAHRDEYFFSLNRYLFTAHKR